MKDHPQSDPPPPRSLQINVFPAGSGRVGWQGRTFRVLVNYWGGDGERSGCSCCLSINNNKAGARYYTAAMLAPPEGLYDYNNQCTCFQQDKWGAWSGFKAQACKYIPPSIYPSQLLLDPLLPLIHIEITKASLLGGLSPMPWQSANVNPSMLLLLPLKSSLKVLVPTAAVCFLPANSAAALTDPPAKSILFIMLFSRGYF